MEALVCACCTFSHLSLSPCQEVFGFNCRQGLYSSYSWRHLFSVTFIQLFGAPGQNRASPHWVTERWLWEGQRAPPPPCPFIMGLVCSLLRDESSIIEPLFLSLYISLCHLIILHVLYLSAHSSTCHLTCRRCPKGDLNKNNYTLPAPVTLTDISKLFLCITVLKPSPVCLYCTWSRDSQYL